MRVRYRGGVVVEGTLFGHPIRVRLEDVRVIPTAPGWPERPWTSPETWWVSLDIVHERRLLEAHMRSGNLSMGTVRRAIDSQRHPTACDHLDCGQPVDAGRAHTHLFHRGGHGVYLATCEHPGLARCRQ